MNNVRLLLDQREARSKALRDVLKTPERHVNGFKVLDRLQLIGCIKAQIRRLDQEIEDNKKYIRISNEERD